MKFLLLVPLFLSAAWAQGTVTDMAPPAPDSTLEISASPALGPYSLYAFPALPGLSDSSYDAPDLVPGAGDLNAEEGPYGTPDYSGARENPGTLFFDLRAATPFDDFQTGGRLGFSVGKHVATDFFLDMEMRPYRRAVRIRESESLEYQYREERFTFGPGVLARVPLSPGAAFVAGGGAGLSPAWYRGSNREAPSAGLGWLETGIRFLSPTGVDWGFSYQFFPLPGVSPHRVSFQIGRRMTAQ